jgi:hypothetical protein
MAREIYLSLSLEDKKHFDTAYTSVFFTHAATQPAINAEKMLALMQSGLVEVVKLGNDYEFAKDDAKGVYEFLYQDNAGNPQRDLFNYVVNARGQPKSIATDTSLLIQNLLKRNIVQIEEYQDFRAGEKQASASDGQQPSHLLRYKTGSVHIDPRTHCIMRRDPAGRNHQSMAIYAVGAMTRGQIIDASMAQGIVQSTATIANNLIRHLKDRPGNA